MSECSTFISSSPANPSPTGTIGRPQPGRRVAILAGGDIAKTGVPGTISIATSDPGLMLGYLDSIDTGNEHSRGDWFSTGDIGAMDERGGITYHGRADDMMNAGGYRVSPVEVEAAMRQHPHLTDCVAAEFSVRQGVQVIALHYTSDQPLDDDSLASHAASLLARYKQPRLFLRIDEIPRGANGKIQRKSLQRNWSKK